MSEWCEQMSKGTSKYPSTLRVYPSIIPLTVRCSSSPSNRLGRAHMLDKIVKLIQPGRGDETARPFEVFIEAVLPIPAIPRPGDDRDSDGEEGVDDDEDGRHAIVGEDAGDEGRVEGSLEIHRKWAKKPQWKRRRKPIKKDEGGNSLVVGYPPLALWVAGLSLAMVICIASV